MKIQIQAQYHAYLKRVGLDWRTMPPIQYQEMQRCFFGAFGQSLVIFRDDIGSMPEEEAIDAMEGLVRQVEVFFATQSNQQ